MNTQCSYLSLSFSLPQMAIMKQHLSLATLSNCIRANIFCVKKHMLSESILVAQIAMITLKFFKKNPTKPLLTQQGKNFKKKKILPCTKSEVPFDVLHM